MPTLELIAEIQSLKTQLTQCQERLAQFEVDHSEYVSVRREDVSFFVKWFEIRINHHYAAGTMTEIVNRFKAALEDKP